jgi:hypothetical protein
MLQNFRHSSNDKFNQEFSNVFYRNILITLILQVHQLAEETFAALGRDKTLRLRVQNYLEHVELCVYTYISDANIVYYENYCQLVR